MIAASSSSGPGSSDGPGPLAAELERERGGRVVSGPHEAEHPPPLVPRDLDDDVRGGAEAVEAEPFGIAGEAQRAVADQPGAEERRRLQVVVGVGKREAVALVGDDPLRVAAVEVVAGEAGRLAEVLAAGEAVAAGAVRPAEPRNTPSRRPSSVRPTIWWPGTSGSFGFGSSPSTT